MSHEFLIFHAPSQPGQRIEFHRYEPDLPLGGVEDVKAAVNRVFPSVRWHYHQLSIGPAWMGVGGPADFQLVAEPDQPPFQLVMTEAGVDDVQRLVDATGWIALDLQREQVLRSRPLRMTSTRKRTHAQRRSRH